MPVWIFFVVMLLLYSLYHSPVCRNGRPGKRETVKPVIDLVPELPVNALARHDDFIVTGENDPDTGAKKIPVLSGKFITAGMLQKPMGQAGLQRDEGSSIVSGKWV
jgi:hypothetical protein